MLVYTRTAPSVSLGQHLPDKILIKSQLALWALASPLSPQKRRSFFLSFSVMRPEMGLASTGRGHERAAEPDFSDPFGVGVQELVAQWAFSAD